MNLGLGMLAQAGQNFLDASAKQHGNTFASRTARPFEQFETPWGKGPYWNEVNIPQVTAANTSAQIHGGVKAAKETGLHPLFALGRSGSFSGGMSPSPRQGPMASGGSRVNTSMTSAALEESAARVRNLDAQADYWKSLKDKAGQAPGGDPNSSFGGSGETISKPGESSPSPAKRPTVNKPNVSSPKTQTLIGKDGRKYKVYHESAQADEINQAWLVAQEAKYGAQDLLRDLARPSTSRARKQEIHRFLSEKLYGRSPDHFRGRSSARAHKRAPARLTKGERAALRRMYQRSK